MPQIKEGDIRINPQTGLQETYTPEGIWQSSQPIPQAVQPAITADSLTPATPIELPKFPQDTMSAGILEGGQAMIDTLTKQMEARTLEVAKEAEIRAKETTPDWFTKYLESPPPVSPEIAYEEAYKTAGIEPKSQAVIEGQKQLDLLNAQLRDITVSAQAQNLQLEKQISGGATLTAGSADLLNRQQQEVNRQAAIKSLPLHAQILAQQAVLTGNQNALTLAQQKMDTLFKLKSDYADKMYAYNKEIRDRIWDWATDKEKEEIKRGQEEEDRKYEQEKANLAKINEWQKTAISTGQSNLISELSNLDPKDPNFESKLGAITAKIVPKEEEKTTADITEYNFAVAQGYKGSFTDYQREMANLKAKAITPISDIGEKYSSRLSTEISNLYAGRYGEEGAREKILNILKSEFPDIDVAKDIYNRIPDGYEKAIKKPTEPQPSAWEVDAAIWQWIATEGAGLSDEEKKQQIMQAGRNPESFGIY